MSTTVDYTLPNDSVIQLPKLTVQQIIDLVDEIRDRKIEEIRATVGDDADRLSAIQALDEGSLMAAGTMRWANTARGTIRIVEESLKLYNNGLMAPGQKPLEVDDLGLDLVADVRLALLLLGFKEARAIVSEDAAEDSDPTSQALPSGT